MKKIFLLAFLFAALPSVAAVLTLEPPTTYYDNSAIAPADQARISYTPFWSIDNATWTQGATGAPDGRSFTVPEPPAGSTWWYTATATLDNAASGKAVAVSKAVPFKTPGLPRAVVQ